MPFFSFFHHAKDIYEKVKDIEGITVAEYVAPKLDPEKKPVVEDKKDENDFRYYSDDNKIVLLTYENGKTFILNFNNFDITTTINEVVYTVTAYGYVVIK